MREAEVLDEVSNGYTSAYLKNYERDDKACRVCGALYKRLRTKKRKWCDACQKLHERETYVKNKFFISTFNLLFFRRKALSTINSKYQGNCEVLCVETEACQPCRKRRCKTLFERENDNVK